MKFVALVVALLARQRTASSLWVLVDDLVAAWWRLLQQREARDGVAAAVVLAVYLLVPLVLVALVLHAALGFLFGFFYWVLSAAVIVLVLGRRDEEPALVRFRDHWRAKEWQAAYEDGVQQSLISSADNASQMHQQVMASWLAMELKSLFSPLFWFFLLGPLAALGYWLLALTSRGKEVDESSAGRLAGHWLELLDWLPARVLGLTFALVGDFVSTFERLKSQLGIALPARDLLVDCAAAALRWNGLEGSDSELAQAGERRLEELAALLKRALVTWVVILAMLTLYHPLH